MRKRKILVALYIFFILWVTLFTRDTRSARIVKGLFWEVRMGYWWDIALNMLLFIPLGFLVGEKGWKVVLFGFLLSVFIELMQYVFLLGYCEADDVLNNRLVLFWESVYNVYFLFRLKTGRTHGQSSYSCAHLLPLANNGVRETDGG